MAPCFYCHEPQTSICICLDCRTKYEIAKRDLEQLKKDQELRKKNYWNGIRAKNQAKKNK
jgi:hypothetical protein